MPASRKHWVLLNAYATTSEKSKAVPSNASLQRTPHLLVEQQCGRGPPVCHLHLRTCQVEEGDRVPRERAWLPEPSLLPQVQENQPWVKDGGQGGQDPKYGMAAEISLKGGNSWPDRCG